MFSQLFISKRCSVSSRFLVGCQELPLELMHYSNTNRIMSFCLYFLLDEILTTCSLNSTLALRDQTQLILDAASRYVIQRNVFFYFLPSLIKQIFLAIITKITVKFFLLIRVIALSSVLWYLKILGYIFLNLIVLFL